jgi:hypothetical protein
VGAVRAGAFNLYPSCNPKQEDAMEARFLFIPTDIKGGGDRVRKMRQERFLEYGKNELLVYVRVAAAIGDTHRLFPDVLAAADPQMFWSAVFRHRALCKLLKSMVKKNGAAAGGDESEGKDGGGGGELRAVLAAWKDLRDGVKSSIRACRENAGGGWNYEEDRCVEC